jgi:hypothetical protein
MAFSGFQYSALATQVKRYLPAVVDLAVTTAYQNDTTQRVLINFSTQAEESEE